MGLHSISTSYCCMILEEWYKIEREEILEYPQDKLPVDSEFKGYEQV